MKKLVGAFALLLLATPASFGQSNAFSIGVVGGPSLTTVYGNTFLNEHKTAVGYVAGLTAQYRFSERFSVVTQLAYERKGSVLDIDMLNEVGERTGELKLYSYYDYLTLPLLARASFGDHIKYFINAGPYVGYLLDTEVRSSPRLDFELTSDIGHFKRLDFGLSAGLGLAAPVSDKLMLSFEIRNNLGLANISELPITGGGSIKTNSLNFLIGLSYVPGGH